MVFQGSLLAGLLAGGIQAIDASDSDIWIYRQRSAGL